MGCTQAAFDGTTNEGVILSHAELEDIMIIMMYS